MWAEIHGLEVAERPPLEIPAWLSLDLHGGSEQYFFNLATREMAWKAEAAADGLQIFI